MPSASGDIAVSTISDSRFDPPLSRAHGRKPRGVVRVQLNRHFDGFGFSRLNQIVSVDTGLSSTGHILDADGIRAHFLQICFA